jgi:pimeloyl-ACP methyl ester carboxylesterase
MAWRTAQHGRPHRLGTLLVLGMLWGQMAAAQTEGEVVAARLPNGTAVSAEFRAGKAHRPAVLILHGFLQTRHYLTVSTLADSAAEAGYTVLTPTLSLGISERRQSLQCDAIHTHGMADDIAEIAFWIDWLGAKGYHRIVLMGHSFGSLQLLAYLQQHPDHGVRRLIATSLLDVSRDTPAALRDQFLRQARQQVAAGNTALGQYQLSYCNKYPTPAAAYLSYAAWSRQRILDAVKGARVPITAIFGSEDKRLDAQWPNDLRAAGATVIMIPGANHFFMADHEFDLFDMVHGLLQKSARKTP